MKLKDKNDILEQVIVSSLKELSKLYSKEASTDYVFEYWHNVRHLDLDKNVCFSGVIDVRATNDKGKVISFKRLYDRMIIQRRNIGTVEVPKYGKQENYEEARAITLAEILSKSIAGFVLGMAVRTKDEIEQFNKVIEQPKTEEEVFALGYKYSFVIPERFKNSDGTYSVPDDVLIPDHFWGKMVEGNTIYWN